MPSSQMSDEPQWKLPKETALPAVLNAVAEKVINFTDKKTGQPDSFVKWEWEFKITDGEFAGLRAWGDTKDALTNHPDNKVRLWAEAIRGAEFDMGEGLDTDDLLGVPCLIEVDNTTYEKKGSGETVYLCPVLNVYPADAALDPPF